MTEETFRPGCPVQVVETFDDGLRLACSGTASARRLKGPGRLTTAVVNRIRAGEGVATVN